MIDDSFSPLGCLSALLVAIVGLPIFLVLLSISAPTTIVFTIFVGAIARYTWNDWKHWFINSSQSSNNYTRRNAETPPREEVEVITRMLLGDPDLDCKATKGNGLTIEESVNIHFKRLDKFGRSRTDGEMEYMGPRGGIYIYTARGNRSYR